MYLNKADEVFRSFFENHIQENSVYKEPCGLKEKWKAR